MEFPAELKHVRGFHKTNQSYTSGCESTSKYQNAFDIRKIAGRHGSAEIRRMKHARGFEVFTKQILHE